VVSDKRIINTYQQPKRPDLYQRKTIFFMARKRRKTSKAEIDLLYRKCRYCKAHRTTHFFDRHESACMTRWIIRNENRPKLTTTAVENAGAIVRGSIDCTEFMEECSTLLMQDTFAEADSLDNPQVGDAEPVPSV
jgi:hypothetical protein